VREREVGLCDKLELVDSSKAGRIVIGGMRSLELSCGGRGRMCLLGANEIVREGFGLAVGQRWGRCETRRMTLADPSRSQRARAATR
jgi:hypothetical protein